MPVLTAAGCTNSAACPVTPLPSASAQCNPLTSIGGINDVYFIPCSEEMTEVNIVDTAWWTALAAGSPSSLGALGRGLGSIAKKNVKTDRLSSCEVESVISSSWGLKYILKVFDKSTDKVTNTQITTLINSASRYLAIARMCDGEETVLPIGRFTVSDFDWNVPDNFEELQTVTIEISWFELGLPKVYTVTGLSAIVPKA